MLYSETCTERSAVLPDAYFPPLKRHRYQDVLAPSWCIENNGSGLIRRLGLMKENTRGGI